MLVKDRPEISISTTSLVARIQSGDNEAESELVAKYWKTLFYIINRRAEDTELAADITQETFVIVINKARTGLIENPQALASFIRQTGVNLLLGHFRKEARQKTEPYEHIEIHFEHHQKDLSESINLQQIAGVSQQILDELPTARDRDLLLRFFVYGQSKRTICEEIKLTEVHFDRVLYRARKRLKQILQLKYNIDTDKFSLSSLLMLLLVMQSTGYLFSLKNFVNPVRELANPQHYITDNVMERQSLALDKSSSRKKRGHYESHG